MIAAGLSAQNQSLPQLAVLESSLARGIDPTVEPLITGKIEEAFVKSGGYAVLDRVDVERVLREKEFQLSSGLVGNAEMRQAGEYLGADFVVVATVSRVGQTYAITGKMVDVTSGAIAAQASSEASGKIDILLDLAEELGRKLVAETGMSVAAAPTEAPEPPAAEPEPIYRHSLLAGAMFGLSGADDFLPISLAYYYSITPLLGVTAAVRYDLFISSTFLADAGVFISPLPWLGIGVRAGYGRVPLSVEPDADYGSTLIVVPNVLVRIGRLAANGEFGFSTEAFFFGGNVGLNF
jgi:hypothetical protein